MATIYKGSDSDLFFLSERLRAGELVAVPTETVYGLAASALDPAACQRIFDAKGRPAHDPLIVHVADLETARAIASLNETALALAARFWPGPLTLVLPKHAKVPEIVTSGLQTVAVRMPAHPLMRALLARCGLPLAAPSANPFGYVSPTTAEHVQQSLGARIDHILDGGPCAIGLESTIIDVRDPAAPILLRPGGVPREDLEAALGRLVREHAHGSRDDGLPSGNARNAIKGRIPGAPRPSPDPGAGTTGVPPNQITRTVASLAPGMLDRHYSPRTPVVFRETPFSSYDLNSVPPGVARVCISRPRTAPPHVHWLSETGNLEEAARHLFSLMRELDGAGYTRIEFEPAPTTGVGLAINDRLRRAAAEPEVRGH